MVLVHRRTPRYLKVRRYKFCNLSEPVMRRTDSPSQLKMAPKVESLDCATHLVINSFREGMETRWE